MHAFSFIEKVTFIALRMVQLRQEIGISRYSWGNYYIHYEISLNLKLQI